MSLPPGWTMKGLLELAEIRSGQVDPRMPKYRNLPLIAPDHIEAGTGRLLAIRSAREQGAISGKYVVDSGEVIYSKIRPYLMKVHQSQFSALCSADMYPLKPRAGVDGRYLASVLLGQRFTDFAVGESMRSGIPKVNRDALARYKLPVPPEPEQKAISHALDNADELIQALERLIAKKRDVKHGLMQELLTGRTRLPGFTGEWRIEKLGAVATMGSGGTPPSSVARYYGGGIPWVSISDMTKVGKYISVTEATLTEDGLNASAARLYEPGAVLYAMYASLGECSLALGRVASSQAILGIMVSSKLDREFLYYTLQHRKPQVKLLGQQGTQSNLNASMVRNFDLVIPPIEEQVAIASVLKDADVEIEALERRLESARAVKVGIMQELLTGRTRLPIKEDT